MCECHCESQHECEYVSVYGSESLCMSVNVPVSQYGCQC